MSKRRLNEEEKEFIKCFLLQNSTKTQHLNTTMMRLNKGAIEQAASKWGVSLKTCYTIWEKLKSCDKDGAPMKMKPKYFGNKKPKIQIDIQFIRDMELKHRRTIRTLAAHSGLTPSMVWRKKNEGELRSSTSAVKPKLTEEHKIARLKWCVQQITVHPDGRIVFKTMDYSCIIDEKWFQTESKTERYIVLPDEETPHRTCINKAFIPKLMFMCAVMRPLYGENGELLFDGKLGIWPFVEDHIAQRSSSNRPRGTIEQRPIASINRNVMRDMMLSQIIPAIKRYWPTNLPKNIVIQQDNAPCHISNDDMELLLACQSDGFNITIVNQPARSPDLNVNDLGFFCSIQSLQQEMQTDDIEELNQAVQMAFEALDHQKLDDVFLTCQMTMVEVMKVRGNNKYRQPHMGKARLRALGILPRDLEVDKDLVKDCIEYLLEKGVQIDNPILMEAFGYAN